MKQNNRTSEDAVNRQIWRNATAKPVSGVTMENCYRETDRPTDIDRQTGR